MKQRKLTKLETELGAALIEALAAITDYLSESHDETEDWKPDCYIRGEEALKKAGLL
jgi:uncharacterized protein YegL